MSALARNEAMTRLKEIKGAFSRLWQMHERLRFSCAEFTFEKKWLPNEGELLKAARIMPARRRRQMLSYLFLSRILLSVSVHLESTDIPARKNIALPREEGPFFLFFPRRLGKRASFVMDYRERSTMHIVHCQSIKRFVPPSATSKRT